MDESLSEGDETFTRKRIKRQLQDDTFLHHPDDSTRSSPSPLICEKFEYVFENGVHRYFTPTEQTQHRQRCCRNLYEQVLNPDAHCSRLDQVFSQIVACNFQPKEGADEIVDHTGRLLSRFPARSLELPDTPDSIDPDFLAPASTGEENLPASTNCWQRLQVTSYVSVSVIRSALLLVIYHHIGSGMLTNFLDTIADLMTTASELSSVANLQIEHQRWFLVRAFLWSSWQRCTMLYFYGILGRYLKSGFADHDGPSLILRGFLVTPRLSIQAMSKDLAGSSKSRYMCGWAFELLRCNTVCINLDFRRFCFRYSMVFGSRPGRCIGDDIAPCAGDEPGKCQRFRGLRIDNQSHHDSACGRDCQGLLWDEESYRSVTGARAVAFELHQSQVRLTYCEASENTLAISHVWSHGQGGRPEIDGLRHCLHQRYVSIARALGCDSYWMDTPCIPEDHRLRGEAIKNINKVFEHSKATLVCDKDLMDIDASDMYSVKTREIILATVLVCDWNLRAWTFLEAFRGRYHIFLLCKDNVTVSLKETIEIVYSQGSIDIAYLLLTSPHLLPSLITKDMQSPKSSPFVNGFLTIETAGSLLSHREASRPGDDIVIWSLLLDDTVFTNVKSLWKSRRENSLPTSFLISSAPRLKYKGLHWAPSSPTAQLIRDRSTDTKIRLLAFDGMESEVGLIKREGFLAKWLMHDLTGPCFCARKLSSILEIAFEPNDMCPVNINTIRQRYLKGYLWGALLRPVNSRGYSDPATNRNDTSKIFMAVCATNRRWTWQWEGKDDDTIHWRWRGVYEWNQTEPLPHFEFTKDVLLV